MGAAVSRQRESSQQVPVAEDDLGALVLGEYDREHLALRRYVAYLGLDADTAQDVVHEAFVKLHSHLAGGGDRTNLRAWLYRVVHNLARNRQDRFDASHANLDVLTGIAEPVSLDATPEQAALHDERERRLRLALMRLSEGQRECLVLRAQGLKYREIAEAVGLSVSTVAEHVQRGLELLKEFV